MPIVYKKLFKITYVADPERNAPFFSALGDGVLLSVEADSSGLGWESAILAGSHADLNIHGPLDTRAVRRLAADHSLELDSAISISEPQLFGDSPTRIAICAHPLGWVIVPN